MMCFGIQKAIVMCHLDTLYVLGICWHNWSFERTLAKSIDYPKEL